MKNEIFTLINKILAFLTGKTGEIFLDYPTENNTGFFFLWIFFATILVFVMVKVIHGKKIWPLVILTAVVLCCTLAGLIKAGWWMIPFVFCMVLLIFWRNFKSSGYVSQIKGIATAALIVLICGAIGLLPVVLYKDFSTEDEVQELKLALHEERYECGDNAMPEGDLTGLGPRSDSIQPALELEAESFGKLYLKGMVGEIYTGTSWESLGEEEKIRSESLFYWLHKEDFYGQAIISKAAEAVKAVETGQLSIRNLNACHRYQYLPYGLSSTDSLDKDKIVDAYALAETDEQTIAVQTGSVPQWYEIALQLFENKDTDEVKEFLKKEQSYSEFVAGNYLQLNNGALGFCRRIFGESSEERSLSEILEIVLTTLDSSLEYNEIIVTENGVNDFFQYTLEQEKQGYDVHYATAATLMLRYFGVPARYVEGYFLSAEEAAGYENAGTIVLDESHAHAWTEFYMDGIGWIPFEVTPGYIDDEEISAVFSAIEGALNESNYTEKTYAENDLVYTPPKRMETEQEVTLPDNMFRFRIQELLNFLWILPVMVLVILSALILRRRHKLVLALRQMEQMDNRQAIAAEFAYATKLMKLADLNDIPETNTIRQFNNEAIFSNHEMSEEQRQAVCSFRKNVLDECKGKWSLMKKFYCHYVLWIYR